MKSGPSWVTPARKDLRALEALGLRVVRQRGSHMTLIHPGGRASIVTIHPAYKIGPGLFRTIIRDAGVSWEGFIELA